MDLEMVITDEVLVEVPYGHARIQTISGNDPAKISIQFMSDEPSKNLEGLFKTKQWFKDSFKEALLDKAVEGNPAARIFLGYGRDEMPDSAIKKPELLH